MGIDIIDLNGRMQVRHAFQMMFPHYKELLQPVQLTSDDSIETFLRDQLPAKVEMVRTLQHSYNSFLTNYNSVILKRPHISSILHSLLFKITDKTKKLCDNLSMKAAKMDKIELRSCLSFLDFPVLREDFRRRMKDLEEPLREKYFKNAGLERDSEERIAACLCNLLEMYYFLKRDMATAASNFRLDEKEVLSLINNGLEPAAIVDVLILDASFQETLFANVQKRCRPFTNKRQQLEIKLRDILRQAESRQPLNLLIFIQSILTKEKQRAANSLCSKLQKEFEHSDHKTVETNEAEAKEIMEDVAALRRDYATVCNNAYFLEIMRGAFPERYKMDIAKIESLFYLTNLEKYLQEVTTFLEKLLRLEERIISNRKAYMVALGGSVEAAITLIVTANSETSIRLQDLIDQLFSELQSALEGSSTHHDRAAQTKEKKMADMQTEKKRRETEQQEREKKRRDDMEMVKKREEEQRKIRAEAQRKDEQRRAREKQSRAKAEADRMEEMARQTAERKKVEIERARKEQQQKIRRQSEMKARAKEESDRAKRVEEAKRQEDKKKQAQREIEAQQEKKKKEKANQGKIERQRREKEQAEERTKQKERERIENERIAKQQQKIVEEKANQIRLNKEKADRQKAENDRLEKERLEQERQKLEKEKIEQDLLKKQKAEKERLQREKADKMRIQKEKADKQRIQRQNQEKAERERIEKQRKEIQKIENEKIERERIERERIEREKQERQRIEREKIEREKIEREKIEREKIEKERIEKERIEKERIEKEKAEKIKLEKERAQKQKAERERIQNERIQKEKRQQERLQRQRVNKQRAQREKTEKEEQERKKKELQNKRKGEVQKGDKQRMKKNKQQMSEAQKREQEDEAIALLDSIAQETKKKKTKTVGAKSQINYNDFNEGLNDEIDKEQIEADKIEQLPYRKEAEEDYDGYEDDFELPSSRKQQELKILVDSTNINTLNLYMKGTAFARKNKANFAPYNTEDIYVNFFEEFITSGKLFFFTQGIPETLLQLGEDMESKSEEDLMNLIGIINEEVAKIYSQTMNYEEESELNPATTYVFPFRDKNSLGIRVAQINLELGSVILFLEAEPNEATIKEMSSFVEGCMHVFSAQDQLKFGYKVLSAQSREVLNVYEGNIPLVILLFAAHYEKELDEGGEIVIDGPLIERCFYCLKTRDQFTKIIEVDAEKIMDFFVKMGKKYESNDKISILNVTIPFVDGNSQLEMNTKAHEIKQEFLTSKLPIQLVLFMFVQEDEETGQPIAFPGLLMSLQRKPVLTATYFFISRTDQDQENIEKTYNLVASKMSQYEEVLYTSFVRYFVFQNYMDWVLALWAHVAIKKKFSPLQAMRAIVSGAAPFHLAYLEQD